MRFLPSLLKSGFQSTLPAGEATTLTSMTLSSSREFQSTLPAGEATKADASFWSTGRFQSTLPAGEATIRRSPCGSDSPDFNPRFPRGKRQDSSEIYNRISVISIHASRGGSDEMYTGLPRRFQEFQSTLPAGEATSVAYSGDWDYHQFQSTLPAGEATNVHDSDSLGWYISIHASRGGSDWFPSL